MAIPAGKGFNGGWLIAQARAGFVRLVAVTRLVRRALSSETNPFLGKELRREARSHSTLFWLGSTLLMLGGVLAFIMWLEQVLPRHILSALRDYGWGRAAMVGLSAMHAWIVFAAATVRTREAAVMEDRSRMWQMVLLTPFTNEEIILFKSVYPILFGVSIALAPLPVYLLASTWGRVSLEDIGWIMLVLALCAVRLVWPAVQPPAKPGQKQTVSAAFAKAQAQQQMNQSSNMVANLFMLVIVGFGMRSFRATNPAAAFATPITWVTDLAAVLPSAYPWFRIPVPPLLFMLTVGACAYGEAVRTAGRRLTQLVTGEIPPRQNQRWFHGLQFASVLVVLGYVWQPLFLSGTFPRALGYRGAHVYAAALALTCAGMLFYVATSGLWRAPGVVAAARAVGAETGTALSRVAGALRQAGRVVIVGAGFPLGLLAAAFLLGGGVPAPGDLPAAGRVLILFCATYLCLIGCAAWLGSRQGDDEAAQTPLSALVIVFLLLPLGFWLPDTPAPWIATLSPVSALLGLMPGLQTYLAQLPWKTEWPPLALYPAAQAAVALLMLALAARRPSRARAAATGARARAASRLRSVPAWASGLVDVLAARVDSPVLIKDLREARSRGTLSTVLNVSLVLTLVLAAMAFARPGFFYDMAANRFMPFVDTRLINGVPLALVFTGMLSTALAVFGLAVIIASPWMGSQCILNEHQKGTLGFLLSTPLRGWEILLGKLAGSLMPLWLAGLPVLVIAGVAGVGTGTPDGLRAVLLGALWVLSTSFYGAATSAALLLLVLRLRAPLEDAHFRNSKLGRVLAFILPKESDLQSLALFAMFGLMAEQIALQFGNATLTVMDRADVAFVLTPWEITPLLALQTLLAFIAAGIALLLVGGLRKGNISFPTSR